ncbi:MAG: major facilitator superfamily 1, partial [Arthrobacter sp.]|nr:major facilitator superfamily 1 [Arthrobacter sp.]
KKSVVLARYARNRRLGDALYGQAFTALSASPGAYYDARRARGATHHQPLRALGNRLVGILHGCLRHTTPSNGWLAALPVPLMLICGPSWAWIVAANVLLAISQGLTWSTAVIMKMDLVGSKQRGPARGFNEAAGCLGVAVTALATGYLATTYGLRPPLSCSEPPTSPWAGDRQSLPSGKPTTPRPKPPGMPASTPDSLPGRCSPSPASDRSLSTASQGGLVNNLNDGLAWGLLPVSFAGAGAGLSLGQIGILAAYPAA